MKLTPEQIGKIEAVLTMREDGHTVRAIIIEHNITDISCFSGFIRTMKDLGIFVTPAHMGSMSKEDREAFIEWMREKKKALV